MSLVLADVQPTDNPRITEITVLKEFEKMTNGEVIQAIFDVMVLTVKDGKVWVEHIFFPFDEVWWNAPYQKGGE